MDGGVKQLFPFLWTMLEIGKTLVCRFFANWLLSQCAQASWVYNITFFKYDEQLMYQGRATLSDAHVNLFASGLTIKQT